MIGRPTTKTFFGYTKNKIISNCPVTRPDILVAEESFGPNVGALKGKTTRSKPFTLHVQIVNTLARIIKRYKKVILSADIMQVNKTPFIITISKNICIINGDHIGDMESKNLVTSIKQVKNAYMQRGFCVTEICTDGQFESIRANLAELQINKNVVSCDEHFPEAESCIRKIKERMHGSYSTLTFISMLQRLIIEPVYWDIFGLTYF